MRDRRTISTLFTAGATLALGLAVGALHAATLRPDAGRLSPPVPTGQDDPPCTSTT